MLTTSPYRIAAHAEAADLVAAFIASGHTVTQCTPKDAVAASEASRITCDGSKGWATRYAKPTTVHVFASSGQAYDATQCDDDIRTGDVLLIPSEGVVGIADTWPVAVTLAFGKLHHPNGTLAQCLEGRAAAAGIAAALRVAAEHSFATLS